MTIKWDVTKEEATLIRAITDRAMCIYELNPWTEKPDWQGYRMSLTACHRNGCPLALEALLGAKEIDFMHDFLEIDRHISRETGRLQNCFYPRYGDYSKEGLAQY